MNTTAGRDIIGECNQAGDDGMPSEGASGQFGQISELVRLQNRSHEILGEMRADIASVKQSVESQSVRLSELREAQTDTGERLRSAELRLERLPHIEREMLNLHSSHQGIDGRLRAIELGGAKSAVVASAASRFGWHLVTGVISAVISAAAVWVAGGTPKS